MKEKIKNFFVQKKELLIFVGILTIVFAAVITIASLTLNSDEEPAVQITDDTNDTGVSPTTDGDNTDVAEIVTFGLPVDENAIEIRCYYSSSKSEEELETAIINNKNNYYESKGITYANKDDSAINVYSVYDGTVLDIIEDESRGNVVSIDHGNGIISYYYSLSTVSVSKGDSISKGDKIGVGGVSSYDPDASNHVTIEIKVNGFYVDPSNVYLKEASYVSALVDEGK